METPMSVSSPRWCFVCVSLLYNTPNPQADSDNIDSMTLYLFLCWGLIQQKSRQTEGRNHKRLEKRKGLITGVPLCSISMCFTETLHTLDIKWDWISHSIHHRLPVQLERGVQRSQTARHFQYLCALILTDRKQQYQRVQGNSGLSYHIKLFPEPLLDSVSSEVLLSGATFEWSGQGARSCRDAARTTDSASARRTRARS